jgi:hypothetical protein
MALFLASLVALAAADGAIRLFDLMPAQRAAVASPEVPLAGDVESGEVTRTVVHPFRGFTPRPGFETDETSQWHSRSNIFGIRSLVADPRSIADDDLVVGIFGGSVARGTSFRGREAMRRAILSVCPEHEESLRIVNFAISGYKQPQQLYLLSELLLLDVPIDVVVNIDGFNEIALGGTDADRGNHPLYPERNFWLTTLGFARGALTGREIEMTADVLRLKRRTASRRELFNRLPIIRRSALAQSVVGSVILNAQREAVAIEDALRSESLSDRARDVMSLSDPCLGATDECRQLIADIWKKSSEQMRAVAETSGASYLHFLQPNQYVADSKPLTDDELATAWAPQRPWSRAAASGYPFLQRAGRELAAGGVDFHDLSYIFADHSETIYNDVCCHFNERGYEIVGQRIGELVGRAVADE